MKTTDQPLVMLIDDNAMDIFVGKKFLTVSGITNNIITFQSAREALDYLCQYENEPDKLPSLILLDIQMPEINGFQFLELFKNIPADTQEGVKIIMLSSTLDPVDIERANAEPHVLDILKKPLDPVMLKMLLLQNKISKAA